MKLQNPWPEGYSINKRSPFGYRIHPISGKKKFHNGVDVAGSFPVTAAADGVVSKIGWSPKGGGHTVLIDHGEIVTVYYHGAHATALKKGQRVKAGDFIYTSGTTGASTGNHLHFEVRNRGGRWGDVLDPELFLVDKLPVETEEKPEPKPEPKPVKRKPARRPMSASLAQFFAIRKALK